MSKFFNSIPLLVAYLVSPEQVVSGFQDEMLYRYKRQQEVFNNQNFETTMNQHLEPLYKTLGLKPNFSQFKDNLSHSSEMIRLFNNIAINIGYKKNIELLQPEVLHNLIISLSHLFYEYTENYNSLFSTFDQQCFSGNCNTIHFLEALFDFIFIFADNKAAYHLETDELNSNPELFVMRGNLGHFKFKSKTSPIQFSESCHHAINIYKN